MIRRTFSSPVERMRWQRRVFQRGVDCRLSMEAAEKQLLLEEIAERDRRIAELRGQRVLPRADSAPAPVAEDGATGGLWFERGQYA